MQTEENALEQALWHAVMEPADRPEFLRILLESTVFVPGYPDSLSEGHKTVEAGSQVKINRWRKSDDSSVIPFFSSLDTLRNSTERKIKYMELSARSFFELTCGSGVSLLLNPSSKHTCEFSASEIETLLLNHG
ncbi:MAG: SseB family protein [Gammaproteobacteria bacterium]|nr:SseB family protein [Gammaproteobacteria bacterium]